MLEPEGKGIPVSWWNDVNWGPARNSRSIPATGPRIYSHIMRLLNVEGRRGLLHFHTHSCHLSPLSFGSTESELASLCPSGHPGQCCTCLLLINQAHEHLLLNLLVNLKVREKLLLVRLSRLKQTGIESVPSPGRRIDRVHASWSVF